MKGEVVLYQLYLFISLLKNCETRVASFLSHISFKTTYTINELKFFEKLLVLWTFFRVAKIWWKNFIRCANSFIFDIKFYAQKLDNTINLIKAQSISRIPSTRVYFIKYRADGKTYCCESFKVVSPKLDKRCGWLAGVKARKRKIKLNKFI